jgi:hypothetical protein
MNSVTVFVSMVFSALALILPAPYSLAIYVAAMVSYPTYVKMSVAGLDFTVLRVVILAVLLRGDDCRVQQAAAFSETRSAGGAGVCRGTGGGDDELAVVYEFSDQPGGGDL